MERTLALSHGILSWDDIGSHRAALTIVLLHGFPHDRSLWSAQAAAHESAFPDVRLLIPDLPGFGRSAPLPMPSVDGFADALEPLLDAADVEQAVIGGLSMGGYVAFAFWRRHAARVRALMLLDTKAGADSETAKEGRRELIATVQRDGPGAITAGLVSAQLGNSTRATNPSLVERTEVMMRRAPAIGITGTATALMERIDSTPTLDTITVPTLVIVGDEDTVTPPSDALEMSAGIRGARLVTIPGAGHLAPLEQPAIVNAAIGEFLDVAVR
ncbi:MAG TPA: alpha/beta fold hydrolase [Gemmatimonadaceae bacterium]|nr:alpha/beta fold hydrolase [Gemmatimonadaceae bacterium]